MSMCIRRVAARGAVGQQEVGYLFMPHTRGIIERCAAPAVARGGVSAHLLDQHLDHRKDAFGRSEVQCCTLVVVPLVNGTTLTDNLPNALGVALDRRVAQIGRRIVGTQVTCQPVRSPTRLEELNDSFVTGSRGVIEGCASPAVDDGGVGAQIVDQMLYLLEQPLGRCKVQCRTLIIVALVDAQTLADEQPHALVVPLARCMA
mmetsp:Transcript_47569/g.124669  ORF Transcript_47569/g.124669 Transcript_47569/m.124669 type:complete len:203 (+) Transcript_47569:257-865(+)